MRKSLAWKCFAKDTGIDFENLQKTQFNAMTKFREWHSKMMSQFCLAHNLTRADFCPRVEKKYLEWLGKKFEVKE